MRAVRRLGWVAAALALAAGPWAACDLIVPARSPGEKLWRRHCAQCHGVDGSGNTPRFMGNPGADLLDDSWRHGGDDGSIRVVIREGVVGEMPGLPQLSDQEVADLVHHLRVLRGERTES